MIQSRPWVWLPADHRLLGAAHAQSPFLVLGDKYARALRVCAGAQPVMFPLSDTEDLHPLLSQVDGVMLTGSPSNIHPSHFGQEVADPSLPLDPARDGLTLAMVRACVEQGIPLLGICRGFQEMNVALGGSLLQQVHNTPGRMDHREPKALSYDEQYALRHELHIEPGSVFEAWAGGTRTQVNSLHGQGVDRLADGLEALAHAPDGQIEAFGLKAAKTFAYGVQWHPEWQCGNNPFYSAIFQAFGAACQTRRMARQQEGLAQ